jgi:hypothetical protein
VIISGEMNHIRAVVPAIEELNDLRASIVKEKSISTVVVAAEEGMGFGFRRDAPLIRNDTYQSFFFLITNEPQPTLRAGTA